MNKSISLNENLENYLIAHNEEHKVLKELREFTFRQFGDSANMQISLEQASLLSMLIKLGKFKKILELGTFAGYSSLVMAIASDSDAKIITIDKDVKTSGHAVNFWKKANVNNKIELIQQDATKVLKVFFQEKIFFDFIFVDADKAGYRDYFDICSKLVVDDGLMVFDNVLWKGKVADMSINDKKTVAIREFNDFLKNDKNFDQIMISIGDGVTVCRKKKNLK